MAKISLQDVSIEYPIYNAGSLSLRHQILAVSTGGRISREDRRIVTVKALAGINLEIRKGDRIGLVGHNGSGKSTLLRTLAGIYTPTRGHITINGRVSTVFGLGAGMDTELTGYENIVRMGMMLGATRAESKSRIPDIEEFSELGDFLAMPVRTYSDGMKTRLSFGVATAAQPEILLVDEVLGAGDAEFQQRAQSRMVRFVERSSIFVLASHSTELLKKYCTQIIHLEHGQVVSQEAVENAQVLDDLE
ncbi:ABC transporter ATP-binding protein [Aurantimonas sp. NFXS3]|uniref:ABC transporter ATP-binding protein n=1 Tax=Aurantimonas sp. NFXS3 TaxID=2818434 RepID=UPI003B8C4DDC